MKAYMVETNKYDFHKYPSPKSPILSQKGVKIAISKVWAWKILKTWGVVCIYGVVWTFSIESYKYRPNAFPLGRSLAQISPFWAQKGGQNNNFHGLSMENA